MPPDHLPSPRGARPPSDLEISNYPGVSVGRHHVPSSQASSSPYTSSSHQPACLSLVQPSSSCPLESPSLDHLSSSSSSERLLSCPEVPQPPSLPVSQPGPLPRQTSGGVSSSVSTGSLPSSVDTPRPSLQSPISRHRSSACSYQTPASPHEPLPCVASSPSLSSFPPPKSVSSSPEAPPIALPLSSLTATPHKTPHQLYVNSSSEVDWSSPKANADDATVNAVGTVVDLGIQSNRRNECPNGEGPQSRAGHTRAVNVVTDTTSLAGVSAAGVNTESSDHERLPMYSTRAPLEDFERDIRIEKPNNSGTTVAARALFDTGNRGETMISLELAQRLGYKPNVGKYTLWGRFWRMILRRPKDKHRNPTLKIEHLDGKKLGGRLEEVEIRWSGVAETRTGQCIFFWPKFVETKCRVMKKLHADVVFSLQEIQRLGLNKTFVGGNRVKNPEADKSQATWDAYQARLEENRRRKEQLQASNAANSPQPPKGSSTDPKKHSS